MQFLQLLSEDDKQKHAMACTILHLGITKILQKKTTFFFSFLLSSAVVVIVSIGKEVYDDIWGSFFDIRDLEADFIGYLIASVVMSIQVLLKTKQQKVIYTKISEREALV